VYWLKGCLLLILSGAWSNVFLFPFLFSLVFSAMLRTAAARSIVKFRFANNYYPNCSPFLCLTRQLFLALLAYSRVLLCQLCISRNRKKNLPNNNYKAKTDQCGISSHYHNNHLLSSSHLYNVSRSVCVLLRLKLGVLIDHLRSQSFKTRPHLSVGISSSFVMICHLICLLSFLFLCSLACSCLLVSSCLLVELCSILTAPLLSRCHIFAAICCCCS